MPKIVCLVLFISFIIGSLRPIKVFFSTTYRIGETVRLIKNKPFYLISCLLFLIAGLLVKSSEIATIILFCGHIVFCILYLLCVNKQSKKTTKKGARLLVLYCILSIAICILLYRFSLYFIALILPYPILFVAKIILIPLEKTIERSYESKAKAKLDRINPTIIAITGSFGKTTFKNMLAHILSTQYSVCVSPESYNTPQGITITVNNYLKENDEILICEFGARKSGDIARLTKLVNPDYCVLLGISNQHLETFKTQRNLIKEKYSIFYGGEIKGFFNGDDEVVKMLYNSHIGAKAITGKSVFYKNARIENGIQKFDLHLGKRIIKAECPMLADYVPSLVALATLIAKQFKIKENNLKFAINTLKPVAHRLELIYNGKDVIIDDAFNSNEKGFKSAVNLLATFTDKTKVLITPGVVELGDKQFEVNEILARWAKDKIDYLLCYGVNSTALKSGAQEKARVFVDLNSCVSYYKTIIGERVVLFENDLPDVY